MLLLDGLNAVIAERKLARMLEQIALVRRQRRPEIALRLMLVQLLLHELRGHGYHGKLLDLLLWFCTIHAFRPVHRQPVAFNEEIAGF